MTEKVRESLDSRGASAAPLTDLFRAFCFLRLINLKLHTYDIKEKSLNRKRFKNRKQRVRLNNTCSKSMYILFGVTQGSIFGPLLFDTFPCDILFLHDIT